MLNVTLSASQLTPLGGVRRLPFAGGIMSFVAGARVELATFRLSVERSNQMSYPAITGSYLYWRLPSHLATTPELGLGWIRTNDGCLFKRCVLY